MKKYKRIIELQRFQQRLDNRFGKGLYKAGIILLLFGCLLVNTSCQPDPKLDNNGSSSSGFAQGGNSSGSSQQTATETNNPRTAGTRITITNTGQTQTLNTVPDDTNDGLQRITDVYFAKKVVTNNGTEVNFIRINDSILGKTVYLIIETVSLRTLDLDVVIKPADNNLSGNTNSLELMKFNPDTSTFVAATLFTAKVGDFLPPGNDQKALKNNTGGCAYTNLETHGNKAIIKLQLRPNTRATFDTWAQNIGTNTRNLEVVVERSDKQLCAYGNSTTEVAGAGTFLNDDTARFGITNKNFYDIYHRNNRYNFLLEVQNTNTRKKVGKVESYYTNTQNQRVNITNNIEYFFYDQDDNERRIDELIRNTHEMVQFPANGTGFGRYGTIDAGGQSTNPQENVGVGDHYLKPFTAAALFGVIQEIHAEGWSIDLGDMSSENGSDPWELGQRHHGGHGHLSRRSGLDVDFRYLDRNGNSFHGVSSNPNFDDDKNSLIFDIAYDYGFRSNYATGKGSYAGVNPNVGGHLDHGHWGFNPDFIHTII